MTSALRVAFWLHRQLPIKVKRRSSGIRVRLYNAEYAPSTTMNMPVSPTWSIDEIRTLNKGDALQHRRLRDAFWASCGHGPDGAVDVDPALAASIVREVGPHLSRLCRESSAPLMRPHQLLKRQDDSLFEALATALSHPGIETSDAVLLFDAVCRCADPQRDPSFPIHALLLAFRHPAWRDAAIMDQAAFCRDARLPPALGQGGALHAFARCMYRRGEAPAETPVSICQTIAQLKTIGVDDGLDHSGCRPLLLACRALHANVIEGFMAYYGPDALNRIQTDSGQTALHWLPEQGGTARHVEVLVGLGADPLRLSGWKRKTPLDYAASSGNVDYAQGLLRTGAYERHHIEAARIQAEGNAVDALFCAHMARQQIDDGALRFNVKPI